MIMMPYGRCRSSLQLTGTQTSGTPQAGPPASAGPDPGRGPGRRDDGPAHARLAGGSGGPDRRPGSRGGRGPPGHAVRKGRLLPPGPPAAPSHPGGREPWAVRASGYAARGRRPSNTHIRPVTGLALAHLRDLLARHSIEPCQEESARGGNGMAGGPAGSRRQPVFGSRAGARADVRAPGPGVQARRLAGLLRPTQEQHKFGSGRGSNTRATGGR
jgi:hypothetical protein